MSSCSIAFLHPGAMGSVLASTCIADDRLWLNVGRSQATVARADAAGLTSAASLAEVCDRAEIIVSICPPDAAMEVAEAVAAERFDGIYVDANAIAPERSRAIAGRFDRYVDGSLIGPPPTAAGQTRLYLSGSTELTGAVASQWQQSVLDVRSIGSEIGAASALKMAYAGWTKGSAALLLAVAALADAEGVGDALHTEWELSQPGLNDRAQASAAGAAPKAWRFAGEMAEIAETMGAAQLPTEFHLGAAALYERLADFKDQAPGAGEVLERLRSSTK